MEENTWLYNLAAAVLTGVTFIVLYYIIKFLLNKQSKGGSNSNLLRTILLFLVVITGIISVILTLPLGELRNDIVQLIGYIISAVLALSSATFIGNAFAGIMLRVVRCFSPGDFVTVNDIFGRVTEMGLFHTEIQLENRDLTTLPNMMLVSNPIKVARSSGTFISAEVSLGYDVNRLDIEEAMLAAAKATNLKDSFVLITSLGDFSIVYKVQGLLEEVKSIISSRSRLNAMVIDHLHKAGIEIVSPTFMNQRQIGNQVFIAEANKKENVQSETKSPENVIFDKADQAESIENQKINLAKVDEQILQLESEMKKTEVPEEKVAIENKLNTRKEIRQRIMNRIENKIEKLSDK